MGQILLHRRVRHVLRCRVPARAMDGALSSTRRRGLAVGSSASYQLAGVRVDWVLACSVSFAVSAASIRLSAVWPCRSRGCWSIFLVVALDAPSGKHLWDMTRTGLTIHLR